jgi:DNA polymerase-3 subunit epsilon
VEYVVFDLETTGLSAERDAIVEIGAMLVRDGQVLENEVFQTLVNPEREIPWYASRVHGIRDAHVRDAPKAEEAVRDFLSFVDGRAVVAHNIGFDGSFVRAAAKRAGLVWAPGAEICTVQLSRRAFPKERSHKLDVLAQRFGLEFEAGGRHRSLGDVRVTAHAFVALCRMLGVAC